ncbi:hypothetical protein Jolie1_068 [Mycobacterium phage Julie1]|jgi:hypothetical protein|uniref:Uncharacterized protein n=1 Tax=Mycobacterium phage Julie1 TaxID=1463812 RepID=W8EK13_9CAUD|nr:hypothetical protein CG90_gp68 [Mycobacterium phage Julie1]YP_009032292.1 hypothetical protein FH38_gp66 [Mycobacterium phage Hosp]AHJ88568.1 hypothetical protein Jolie1_068 [Mycobacterium phage Julie1]AHK12020.1 hypothetical protein Hosp_066 [Mycobacterium phage Hosp]
MASRHPSVASLLDHISRPDIPEDDPRWPLVRSVSYTATEVSSPGYGLDGPELTTALRKLMEAQDCLLRAHQERADREAADHG